MRVFLAAVLLAVLTSACSGLVFQPPPPTPQVIAITFTPAVRTWQPAFQKCAAPESEIRLLIEEIPWTHMKFESGLSIRLGSPTMEAQFYAAQIGEEQVVLVVHPENPLSELSVDDVRSIYNGQITTWDELGVSYTKNVAAWSYPEGDELSQIFQAAVWSSGQPAIQAFLAPDPQAMLEVVRDNPGAIGYLPSSWLDKAELKPVTLEPEVTAALRHPVLVISAHELQGLERSLVSCLQTNLK
ncbi:MAG: substrate-binding domain-containing protein [Anaerolineales bacterium]|jgi:phosphate transport system substrate-binding protein|nr:substrate-binding domain-containing protein [Anaerolineales bacterium]